MTRTIKEVIIFETDDGTRFQSREQAERYYRRDEAYKDLQKLVNEEGVWGDSGPSAEEVVGFIEQHATFLVEVLNRLIDNSYRSTP